jgi:hypothetical protein
MDSCAKEENAKKKTKMAESEDLNFMKSFFCKINEING